MGRRERERKPYSNKNMRREKTFYVYILASLSGTLYVGMTNNLAESIPA
jgi:predicted GIY-YIG superfamily endonuclease